MLHIIDYFFILFHGVLMLFNVLGWIIPKWRLANLISLSLTAFSWFVLGICMALAIVRLRIGIGKYVNFWDTMTRAIPIFIS